MKSAAIWILLLVAWPAYGEQSPPAGSPALEPPPTPEQVAAAVERAHGVLWSKFIGDDGLIHDYVGELPTPEDCQLGRPNAIGWWSPIENGPMFTGSTGAGRALQKNAGRGWRSAPPGIPMTASRSSIPIAASCGFRQAQHGRAVLGRVRVLRLAQRTRKKS